MSHAHFCHMSKIEFKKAKLTEEIEDASLVITAIEDVADLDECGIATRPTPLRLRIQTREREHVDQRLRVAVDVADSNDARRWRQPREEGRGGGGMSWRGTTWGHGRQPGHCRQLQQRRARQDGLQQHEPLPVRPEIT